MKLIKITLLDDLLICRKSECRKYLSIVLTPNYKNISKNKVLNILKIQIRNKETVIAYSNLPVAMQKDLFVGTPTLGQNSLVPKMSLR